MSYAVIHMQKFNKGGLRGVQSHNQREKVSRTNPDIDYSKSKYNYDLHNPVDISYQKEIKSRINTFYKVDKAIRKDAVVMCSFIITSDGDFFKKLDWDAQQKYFEDSYNFFADRYGIENIVNATIHMDEATPHMHLGVVPLTADGRLSAKSIFDKKELTSLQTDFVRDVAAAYGLERGIKDSERTHLSEQRFKAEMAKKELERIELQKREAVEGAKQAAEFARKTIHDAQKAKDSIEPMLKKQNAMAGQINALAAEIKALEDQLKGRKLELKELSAILPEKGLMGMVKNVTVEDIENLKKTAYLYYSTKDKLDRVSEAYERDKKFIPSLEERMKIAREKQRLEQFEKVFDKIPQEIKEKLLLGTREKDNSLEK